MLRHHRPLFFPHLEIPRRPLLALGVKLLRGHQWIRAGKRHRAPPFLAAPAHDVRVENIFRQLLHVFVKNPARYRAQLIVPGEKQIHARSLEINRPRREFVPRPGRTVQHKRHQRPLEQRIVLRRRLHRIRPEVQVIVHEQRTEIRPRNHGIARAHKVRVHIKTGVGQIRRSDFGHRPRQFADFTHCPAHAALASRPQPEPRLHCERDPLPQHPLRPRPCPPPPKKSFSFS